MQIILNTYGTYLSVANGRFAIKTDDKTETMPIRQVQSISLVRGTSVSSDALLLALEADIPVLLTDRNGRTLGHFWSGRFGSIATIRKNQALMATHPKGLEWIAGVIAQKLSNQAGLLKKLLAEQKLKQPYWSAYRKAASGIPSLRLQFLDWRPEGDKEQMDLAKKTFRGWEGTASRLYLMALSEALPDKYRFDRRSRLPALDPFNALLNYLYAILYGRVETALFKAGLDPSMGILHSDQYNKPVFTYDFIEPYRVWVEETAVSLFTNGHLSFDEFEKPDDRTGWLVARSGKALVIESLLRFLEEPAIYSDGKKRKRLHHIEKDAVRLANLLKKFEP